MIRHGELVRIGEVAGILEEMAKIIDTNGWQTDRPTDGKWHLSHHPERRGISNSIVKVKVKEGVVKFRDGSSASLSHGQFIGALWRRRERLPDPFKKVPS